MLIRQSLTTSFAALARIFSGVGRAAARWLRKRGYATPGGCIPPQHRVMASRLVATQHVTAPTEAAGTRRSRASSTGAPHAPADPALRGEYRIIRASEIVPAALPSRLIYEDIERLAASIAGGAEQEGVGLLAPVVVRMLPDGRYEMIDGDRRLRACRLIAVRAHSTDFLIPAIVFRVDAHDALLMRVATLDAAEPKPVEQARTYHALRRVTEEAGRAFSARALTMFGRHGKTQISDYVRIGDAITDDVMIAAGIVDAECRPSPVALVDLKKHQLLDAAKQDTVESRAARLKGHLARASGGDQTSPAPSATQAESRDEVRDGAGRKGRPLSLVARSRTMTPAEARALIEREVAPAMLALVDQAHGGRDAEGYYSAFSPGHACLVLPREVEGLTVEQLDRLDHVLATLSTRARRAREERLQVDAMFASVGERKTS